MESTTAHTTKPKTPPERHEKRSACPLPAWTPFPIDELPAPVANFVRAAADSLGCDPAYVALPSLAVCASAIGTSRRIQARADWYEPSVLWTIGIGRSGVMKSPPLDLALAPLREVERGAFQDHAANMADHERAIEQWERDRAAWRKRRADDDDDPPSKPAAPICTRYTTADCTVEALSGILSGNRRGVLMARDEVAGWLRSFDAYRGGKGGDEARWLELHRAGTLLVDRKTDGNIRIERAAVSVTGTIQPGTLERLLTRDYIESGLAGRPLVAHPPVKRKKWTDRPIPEQVKLEYDRMVRGLLGLELHTNDHGEPMPMDVLLSSDARDIFAGWYDSFADTQANAETDAEAAAFSKCEGAALRIALVHHLASFTSGYILENEVTAASICAGIALAEWFANEARRLYGLLNESDSDRERRTFIEWIAQRGGDVPIRKIHQFHHRRFGSVVDLRSELDALADEGYGERYYRKPSERGGQGTECFRLKNSSAVNATGDGDSVDRVDVDNSKVAELNGWGVIQ